MSCRASFVAALAVFAAAPARAETGPEPVRFAWVRGGGADGCATQQQIAERVAARLGKSPFAADGARSIEAVVTRGEHGFRAELYVRAKDGALVGTRELASEAPDCTSLEAASVLAIALAIDPDAGARPPSPPTPPPPATVIAPPPIAPPLPAALPTRPPPERLGGSGVAIRAGVGLGLLPGPAPGASLAGHLALTRSAQLTAEALWLPEARTADGRFGFGLAALSIGACVVAVGGATADFAACGSIWGGALHAVVYDLTPAEPGDYAWAAAAATPRLRVRLSSRLHAEVGAHLLVPIVRRPFVVSGWKDPVFRETPVTVLPFVGLGAHFP